eukprot:TRINITY_DN2546_c0_g2_i1.p1 TRINITY_DN2546_c0_g2~~TRINITY_DN2546_c0_g2_i1.p1  ORF type:complete len:226 (-),score=63.58 TRINITY_DN2546_c0_g2_i1:64-741(-)
MGICGGVRDKPKSGSEMMEQLESETKFTSYSFEDLRTRILHYKTTEANVITERRFTELLEKIGVDMSLCVLVMELFNGFAGKENSVYDIDKLLTAALLFSKSTDVTNDQKAKFLHTMVEKAGPTEIVTQSLKDKLTDLIMLAGYWVPMVARQKSVDTKDELEGLANYTKGNISELVSSLLGKKYADKRKIDIWAFKKIFKQEDSFNIFSSKEIRNHLCKSLPAGS